MGLRADPVGGGQFKQAVQQIIEAESQPIKSLEKRKGKEEARLKLFQDFKTKFSGLDKAVSDVSTFRKFRELKVDLGDGSGLISVTVDKEKAEVGQYTMEVDELASRTSVISNGLESADENLLGMGFISINLANGSSTDVYIDDKNSSLRGIASTINQQANLPVRASVVRDDSEPDNPWKLLLTAKQDGEANQLDSPQFYFSDGPDLYIDDDKEAKNGLLVLDGFELETGTNDINDFLPGVNIHLKQAKPGQPFTMTITEDYQKMSGKVKALIEQMNQVLQFIVKQNAIDANSDTSTTFAGDTSLHSLEYQIRNVLHQAYNTSDPTTGEQTNFFLSQMGIEFERSGQIAFKEDKFNKTLEKNFDQISQAIAGESGLASQLRRLFDSYMQVGRGILNSKEAGIKSRIKNIDNQIDEKTKFLDRKKQEIVNKFSRLESTLGEMQRQQQYLTSSLGGGGGNPIAQLISGI